MQVSASDDEAQGQPLGVVVIHSEMPIASAVVVRNDTAGTVSDVHGDRRLLHVDGYGAAAVKVVDEAYVEFLSHYRFQ